MSDGSIDQLARIASELALRAFSDYTRLNGIAVDSFERASELLRMSVRESMDEALTDVREAFSVGLEAVGLASFRASMVQAGFRAAKEYEGVA